MTVKCYKMGRALTVLVTSQMNHEKNENINNCNILHEE